MSDMPPPGVPDWAFPGAIVKRLRDDAAHIIQRMEFSNNPPAFSVLLTPTDRGNGPIETTLEDLVRDWVSTEAFLYGDVPTPVPIARHEFYRYVDDAGRLLFLFVHLLTDRDVHVLLLPSGMEAVISRRDFTARAVHLGHSAALSEPDSIDTYQTGMRLTSADGIEFFLLDRTSNGIWITRSVRAMMSEVDGTVLGGATRSPEQPWDGLGASFEERLYNGMQTTNAIGRIREILSHGFEDEEEDDPSDQTDFDTDPSEFQVGDLWHFDYPHEGVWVISRATASDNGLYLYHLRSDRDATMEQPGSWIRRVGYRAPSFDVPIVEAGQVWEVPANPTQPQFPERQKVYVNKVTSGFVVLHREHNDDPIVWSELRLRAHGRYVVSERARKTAFEHLLGMGDD